MRRANQYSSVFLPSRLDFFTIWGNGLAHTEDILDILRGERNLEIIRIERRPVRDMERFVFDLYACDSVPIGHLRGKLRYLFDAPGEVLFVFVKNLAPEESYFGEGPYRHLQCGYVKRIKEQIRDLYNPRRNGVRTEEHVIHSSDYEAQVDYVLKMLGWRKGIEYLEGDGEGLPFPKPFHIPRPRAYSFRMLPPSDLWARVLTGWSEKGGEHVLVPLSDTPHYKGLETDGTAYREYLECFRYTALTDDHSCGKLAAMGRLSAGEMMAFPPVLVKAENGKFRILDGVHRAAVALYRGLERIRCVQFWS